jgi:hypothetical protein
MIAAIREQCEKALGRQRIVLRWYVWWMRLQTSGEFMQESKSSTFFLLPLFICLGIWTPVPLQGSEEIKPEQYQIAV